MNKAKLVIAVAALLGSGTALAQVPQWTVSESSGPVSILRPGFSGAAARGGIVRAGDTVATGKNGRAVLVRGEEYLVVSPVSQIVVAGPQPGGMTQIIQKFGNTLFKIKKMATPHFAVETPYLAAVVKGTTFSVTVTDAGASVQVTEGRVQVQTPDGGASYLVTPGVIGIVNRDQPYRLKVHGRESLTIDSPAAPAGAGPGSALPTDAPAAENDAARTDTILATVGEGSVSLATLSGGLVSGDSTLVASSARQIVAVAQPASGVAINPGEIPPPPAEIDIARRTGIRTAADTGAAGRGGVADPTSIELVMGSGNAPTNVGASLGQGAAAGTNDASSAGVGVGAGVGGTGTGNVNGVGSGNSDTGGNGNATGGVSVSVGAAGVGPSFAAGVGASGNGNGNGNGDTSNGGGNGSNGNSVGGGISNATGGVSLGVGAGGAGVGAGVGGAGNGNNSSGLGNSGRNGNIGAMAADVRAPSR